MAEGTAGKRQRRSPEIARNLILEAGEKILLTQGPTELKFKTIAQETGLSQSNIHHHFGGVEEIKRELMARMLARLQSELADILPEKDKATDDRAVSRAIAATYKVMASERNAKLIAWFTLASDGERLSDSAVSLQAVEQMLAILLTDHMPADKAKKLSPTLLYQVAITALGEGLFGGALKASLGGKDVQLDGAALLSDLFEDAFLSRINKFYRL